MGSRGLGLMRKAISWRVLVPWRESHAHFSVTHGSFAYRLQRTLPITASRRPSDGRAPPITAGISECSTRAERGDGELTGPCPGGRACGFRGTGSYFRCDTAWGGAPSAARSAIG